MNERMKNTNQPSSVWPDLVNGIVWRKDPCQCDYHVADSAKNPYMDKSVCVISGEYDKRETLFLFLPSLNDRKERRLILT